MVKGPKYQFFRYIRKMTLQCRKKGLILRTTFVQKENAYLSNDWFMLESWCLSSEILKVFDWELVQASTPTILTDKKTLG